MSKMFRSLIVLVILGTLLVGVLPASGAPPAPDSLSQAARGALTITRDLATGAVTFVRSEGGIVSGMEADALAKDPAGAARRFVAQHEAALAMPGAAQQLALSAVEHDALGMTHVRLQQVFQGVPVFGAEVLVHYAADMQTVNTINGHFVPGLAVNTSPSHSADAALAVARSIDPQAVVWAKPELRIYTSVIDPAVSGNHLAWLIRLDNEKIPARFLYVLDAHSGAVLTSYNELDTARNRQIYTANHSQSLPGTLVRSEGGPATGDDDADHAYQYLGDTYNYFFTSFGRDSYNGAGAAMKATVHYGSNYQNAFWNGTQMVFGDGFPIDDVTAHEMTHAVTENEANLIYQNQSGALNESFSDIFGEIIDMTNGAGNDTPPVAWLMGEDLPGIGAIRSMADPTIYGDPDKVSSYDCTTADNGGVHTNSGIPNKAAYLMAAGGSFNGHTITGIGLDKMGRVQYRALSQYLAQASTFVDDLNALNQSCQDLIGSHGITSADCSQVSEALLAVEMNTAVPCTGGGCAVQTTVADQAAFGSPGDAIHTALIMYRTREQVMRGAPAGEHLIDLYYEHSGAMARILAQDPALRHHMAAFLAAVAPGLDALAGHQDRAARLTISPAAMGHLQAVLTGFEQADPASPLAAAVRRERQRFDLDKLTNQSFSAAWASLNQQMQAAR